MDRFLVRMWDSKYHKMWTFENDGFLECVFECLKQQLAYESKLKVLENISYNHIADGRVFMQCTGLKDKNGNLIYEGDILKNNFTTAMYEVVFRNAGFYFRLYFKGYNETIDYLPLDENFVSITEIIGNIHENPELLEEK